MPVPEQSMKMDSSRRVSVLDRFKKAIGLKVQQKVDDESKASQSRKSESAKMVTKDCEENGVDIFDEMGRIQYRNLNMAMLKKYKNPLKILYLWAI